MNNKVSKHLIIEKLPGYFLLFMIFVAFGYVLYFLRDLVTPVFLAVVLAITFFPLYKKIRSGLGKWERISSFLTCFIVVVIILLPIVLFVSMLTKEAFNTYDTVQANLKAGTYDDFFQLFQWEEGGFFYELKGDIEQYVSLEDFDLKQEIANLAKGLSTSLTNQVQNFLSGIGSLIFGFFIMFFSLFFFFKDGEKMMDRLAYLSPLPSFYEKQLFDKLGSMVKAIVLGVFVTALVQGIIGGIGFSIAGISNPVFWGTAIAFFSLVPVVGTAVVWAPAGIIMILTGNYAAGIFLLIWGALVIGSVDNLLRPFLIGGKAHTHPLLTFLVILGAIFTMGLKGVIVGPLVLMLLIALLYIYEAEYSRILKE